MARPPVFPVEDKFRIVLSVISGEMTVAEAARRGKASEQSISTWKRQFLEGGKAGLVDGGRGGREQRACDTECCNEGDDAPAPVRHARSILLVPPIPHPMSKSVSPGCCRKSPAISFRSCFVT